MIRKGHAVVAVMFSWDEHALRSAWRLCRTARRCLALGDSLPSARSNGFSACTCERIRTGFDLTE